MRNAYKGLKGVTYRTESKFGTASFVSDFVFGAPSKIRLTVKRVGAKGVLVTKICDGKTISVRQGTISAPRQIPYTANNIAAGVPANLESICFFDWAQQLSTASGMNMEHSTFRLMRNQDWNGKKWTVLEETAAAQKVVCTYYIDPKTNIMWRTVVKVMPGGDKANECDCKITQLNLAAKVDESTFKMIRV
jgi:hypothetical protein